MLHLGEGRHDDAWQDLIACHRLGRLVGKGGTLVQSLVGIALDQIASDAEVVYLAHARPTAVQLQARMRDLRALPPLPRIADTIDLGERFMYLDCVRLVATGGPEVLQGFANGVRPKKKLDAGAKAALEDIDWALTLKEGN